MLSNPSLYTMIRLLKEYRRTEPKKCLKWQENVYDCTHSHTHYKDQYNPE